MSTPVFSDFRDPEFASEFARRRHGRAERAAARIAGLAGIREGDRVVDLCCGPGLVAGLLAERVGRSGEVIGVDVSPAMIALARKGVRSANLRFIEGDAYALSALLDRQVDHVVATSAWQNFLLDRERVLGELKRALKPGGRFSFDVRVRLRAGGAVRASDLTSRVIAARWPQLLLPARAPRPVYSREELDRDLDLILSRGFRLIRRREVDEPTETALRDRQGWRVECWLAREASSLPAGERAEILSEVEHVLASSDDEGSALRPTTYLVVEA